MKGSNPFRCILFCDMLVKLGQCYLINNDIIKKLIKNLYIKKKECILEIGSGYGAITRFLISKCNSCILVDIDSNICNYLNENCYYFKNKTILNKNILIVDLSKIFFLNKRKKIRIVGNIPYYLSKKILYFLLSKKKYIQDINIMIQYELAVIYKKNIFSNVLSILLNYFCLINFILFVNKYYFFPIPKVNSFFLRLDIFLITPCYTSKYKIFLNIIKIFIKNKKKKLLKIINNYFICIRKYEILINIFKFRIFNLTMCDLCYLSEILLPKGGIEPPTRGASIHCSTN